MNAVEIGTKIRKRKCKSENQSHSFVDPRTVFPAEYFEETPEEKAFKERILKMDSKKIAEDFERFHKEWDAIEGEPLDEEFDEALEFGKWAVADL